MSIPLQVALIGAVAALVGALINFLSSLLSHWYSRSSRVSNWLFDKQVADVQELAISLDALSKDLVTVVKTLSRTIAYMDAALLTFSKASESPLSTESYQPHEEKEIEEAVQKIVKEKLVVMSKQILQDVLESARLTNQNAENFSVKILDWETFDVARLTTWLEDSGNTVRMCRELSRGYLNFYGDASTETMRLMHSFKDHPSESVPLTDSQEQKLRAFYEVLENHYYKHKNLIDESVALQQYIAATLTAKNVSFWGFVKEALFGSEVRGRF